jgi:hypothetical protein
MTEPAAVYYTVEHIDRAYTRPPWEVAESIVDLSERDAIKIYLNLNRRYHPEPSEWSGHVRIVGSDRWTYIVEPPEPGERSLLCRMYHLDDL